MFHRSLVVLLLCLAVLPACKKKKSDDGGSTESGPGPAPPAAVNSDYVAFAHFRAKDIRENPLFTEVMAAVAKSGGTAEWDKLEQQASSQIGVKPTDIDSVTVLVTEVPQGNLPKYVVILTASKPINKAGVLGLGPQARPDARGFYTSPDAPGMIHFPDDKTMVMLHADTAQKYLDGYAKNRTGWPMNAELSRAAAGHTLYAMLQLDKIPSQMTQAFTRGPEFKDFAPALSARRIILTADLKGKELSVGARVGFPDAAAAGKARDSVQKAIGMAVGEVEKVLSGKGPPELSGFTPAIQEAHRALKDAKVTVSGSDLTVAGSYKADFDVGTMVAEAVKKIQGSAEAMRETNNLKQIGLAVHNYAFAFDHNGFLPVYAIGAKGMPLKNATDKPLLSWRVALLPYIEQDTLYKQFKLDEPWDSPNNKKLIEQMPKLYASPKPGKAGYTHLQMVIGPNAMSPYNVRMPTSFPDGTSNTIAVVEAAEPVIWTKPDDVMMPGNQWPKDFRKKFGGLKPGGFNALLWSGEVKFIPNTMSDRTLGFALNPRDGQVLGKDW